MKENKFRVWDKLNHRWLDLFQLVFAKDGTIIAVNTLGETYGLHQVDLVEYIGRKDKSGKEIYAGDLINCRVSQFEGVPDERLISQLVHYDRRGNLKFGDYCAWFCYEEEIIGSKYENPKLLKGGESEKD